MSFVNWNCYSSAVHRVFAKPYRSQIFYKWCHATTRIFRGPEKITFCFFLLQNLQNSTPMTFPMIPHISNRKKSQQQKSLLKEKWNCSLDWIRDVHYRSFEKAKLHPSRRKLFHRFIPQAKTFNDFFTLDLDCFLWNRSTWPLLSLKKRKQDFHHEEHLKYLLIH